MPEHAEYAAVIVEMIVVDLDEFAHVVHAARCLGQYPARTAGSTNHITTPASSADHKIIFRSSERGPYITTSVTTTASSRTESAIAPICPQCRHFKIPHAHAGYSTHGTTNR